MFLLPTAAVRAALLVSTVLQAPPSPPGPFALDTLRPQHGPEVLWHRATSPLVSIRLATAVPADLPTGAAELVQELARPAAIAAARDLGADLDMRIDAGHAVLSVTGPATAFDGLVAILRAAIAEPDLAVGPLRVARARAEDRVLGTLERPEPRLRFLLRARLAATSPAGPELQRLDAETLRGIAGRMYRPRAMQAVLIGDVPAEIVRSAFAGWQPPPPGPPLAPPDPPPPLPEPQAHNAWAALGFVLDADPLVLAVAAELVAQRVRAAAVLSGAAEAWPHPRGGVLVILGGAPGDDPAVAGAARITPFPTAADGDDASALARFLRRLVAEAAALAGPDAVDGAAFVLRRRILLAARTPAGRAEVVAAWHRHAPVGAVHDVLEGLEGVRLAEVRELLSRALASPPLRVEVRP